MYLEVLSYDQSTFNHNEEMPEIVRIRGTEDARHRVTLQCFCLFCDSWTWPLHFVDFVNLYYNKPNQN